MSMTPCYFVVAVLRASEVKMILLAVDVGRATGVDTILLAVDVGCANGVNTLVTMAGSGVNWLSINSVF